MDFLEGLNAAVEYIENHLQDVQDEVIPLQAAKLAACSVGGFSRLFSALTGMGLTEYVRRRRLTMAAYDLRAGGSQARIIDIAVKYGYESADAFCRAFARQHGVTPGKVRNTSVPLKVLPPVHFHISFTGGRLMDFRIVETPGMRLKGLRKQFEGPASERFGQEHIMWADFDGCDNAPAKVGGEIPGIWYGIWDAGYYHVARDEADTTGEGLEPVVLKGGVYAVFKTGSGGFAGDELPRLRAQIFGAWLKDGGYRQARDYEVEVYHLTAKSEKDKRYYEIWIPLERA
ncbi:MAG: AraC family transcriptional regulator [Defluviitaleaceae bacterium]|nr:AraC family transcriptional regulator [Defluviitaleaceae bacterium]